MHICFMQLSPASRQQTTTNFSVYDTLQCREHKLTFVSLHSGNISDKSPEIAALWKREWI